MKKKTVLTTVLVTILVWLAAGFMASLYLTNKEPIAEPAPAIEPTVGDITTTKPEPVKPVVKAEPTAPSYTRVFVAGRESITADSLLTAINEERAALGYGPLKRSNELERAAQAKIKDMVDNNYFAHVSPTGKNWRNFIEATGYKAATTGENLGSFWFNPLSSKDILDKFVASPLHFANLISALYTEVGVAVQDGVPCEDKDNHVLSTCILIAVEFAQPK